MRALHWVKLPQPLLATSVWAAVATDIESVPINLSETEALFAVPQPPPKLQRGGSSQGSGACGSSGQLGSSCGDLGGAATGSSSAGGGVGGGARRPSTSGRASSAPALQVLSVVRANNVAIFLKKLSKLLTCEQLCASILRMEASVLEPELLESVLVNLPGEAEAKQLRTLRVDAASLSPPERFCFEMARLPRLRSMLHALRLRQSLPASLERASTGLAAVMQAARQLMSSQAFVRILSSILAHGNYLNSNTPRAGARGVKLDGLDKARAVKSSDGKCSLLEYACKATQLSQAVLTSELGGVRAACRLPLLDIIRITQELEEGVAIVRQELALCPLPDLDEEVAADAALAEEQGQAAGLTEEQVVAARFRQAISPFYAEIQHGLEELTLTRDETKALLRRLASWLGEDPAKADADAILKACADLVDVAKACAPPPVDEDDRRSSYF